MSPRGLSLALLLLAAACSRSLAEAAPRAASRSAEPTVPRRLRVGLATDLPRVEVPCCGLVLEAAGEAWAVSGPVSVTPDAASARAPIYRVQVAALKDEEQARALASRLARDLAAPAEAVFDAGRDLYRVRVGRFIDRAGAEAAARRLGSTGVHGAWIATEPGELADPALTALAGGLRRRVPGRWLAIGPAGGGGLAAAGGRWRGRLLVFLNDRGALNLINELPADDYLRGVVPREMGPAVFPSLEALKAQTVAARTYTLRNLGEFAAEGYDICATPRCQVYGGMAVEHPLADRAVAETAGEVLLHQGELVDALYSATCGGHTEDVRAIFPLKDHPYLKGVPCWEAGPTRLGTAAGTPFPQGLARAWLGPAGEGSDAPALGAQLASLARLAGLPSPADRLGSLAPAEVRRYLGSAFDLALDLTLLGPAPAVAARRWGERERRLADFLVAAGLLASEPMAPAGAGRLPPAVAGGLVVELASYLGLLRAEPASFLAVEPAAGGDVALRVRGPGGERSVPLIAPFAAFREDGEAAALDLRAGDRLILYWGGERLVGVRQLLGGEGRTPAQGEGTSPWSLFRTDEALAALAETRYPGLGFRGFEILARGVSGRVSRLRLVGAGGKSAEVEGLAVRWTLDLPDTWFSAERAERDGRRGWLFRGRGWGHGVGMCQRGAVAMGFRGLGYRDILGHFYAGAEVVRLGEPAAVAAGP